MENKGCITCRKCEQIRSNFFCGRTRLSQKQLYNKYGFCSDYEPKEQIEKPMTNEEWFDKLSTEEKAMVIICCCPYESDWFGDNFEKRIEQRIKDISKSTYGYEHGVNKIKNWLKQPHTIKE